MYVVSFSSYLTLNNHDLEKVTEGHSSRYHSNRYAVSYSPSIVTMAVSLTVYDIFSVKQSRDLEKWVRGSLKVTENGAVR